ncbi:transposase (plasmid) [Escherichia coli]|nr:transposase [Escherichia coli]
MATLCHVFGGHRSSYRYWKNRPEKPDGRRAVLRSQVLELHASATVRPEQEALPQWQPGEATRWDAGLLAGS